MASKIGTTERTNELLGGQYFDPATGKQIKEFKPTPLPVSSAPTVANKINPMPEPRTPTVSPYYGNIGEATASNTGYSKQLEIRLQQIADAEAEKKALAESKNVKEEKGLLKSLLNTVSPQDARKQAIEETGIDPKKYFADQRAKIAEIEKLSQDYDKTVAERDTLIQQAETNEGQGSLSIGVDSRVTALENKYKTKLAQKSANINTKVATAQALEGNFKEAQTFVNQAVQDATSESKFRYDQYVTLKEANESAFEKIDSKYTKAFDAAMNLAKDEYENQRADKKVIGELLISNPQAGIDIYNDTLEEALNKINLNPESPDYLYKLAQTQNIIDDNIRLNKGSGGNLTEVDSDAQDYLDGVLSDEDFKDKDYLIKVKKRANQIAQASLEAPVATSQDSTASSPRNLYSDASAAGDFLIDGVGGAVNSTSSSIYNYLFGK